jgi:hypothetical protein
MMNANHAIETSRVGRVIALASLRLLSSMPSRPGTLTFFESTSGPGTPLSISTPATRVSIDVDYDAASDEGGR